MVYNKYHNKRITIDNITFDSESEGRRYQELKILKQTGKIKDFQIQPPFPLAEPFRKCPKCNHKQGHIKGSRKKKDILCEKCGTKTTVLSGITYYGDFLIINNDGTKRLEDVKGTMKHIDPVFKLKRLLFEKLHSDLTINIVIMGKEKKAKRV